MVYSEQLPRQVEADLSAVFGPRPELSPPETLQEPEPQPIVLSAAEPPPRGRGGFTVAAVGGLTAACLAGVAAGIVLPRGQPPAATADATPAEPAAHRTLQIVAKRDVPPPVPQAEPLAVLPEPATSTPLAPAEAPEFAARGPRVVGSTPLTPADIPPRSAPPAFAAAPPPARSAPVQVARAAPPPPVYAPPPAYVRPPAPSAPRSVAVPVAPPRAPAEPACGPGLGACVDQALAAADQALAQAFNDARRAGVPQGELRAEQDEWQAVQTAAAGRSRNALLQAYRDRIGMLRELAQSALDAVEPARPAYGYANPGYAPRQGYAPQGYGPQGYGPQGYGPGYGYGYGYGR